jgi:hypothetical protein
LRRHDLRQAGIWPLDWHGPGGKYCRRLVLNGRKGGTDKQILAGLQWAIQQGVDVISMSLGGLTLSPDVPSTYTVSILNALRLGIPVVTAIGNDGSQTSGSPANDFFSFAIGATDHRDRVAGFSGGRTHVIRQSRFIAPENLPLVYSKPDISAPGVGVYSRAQSPCYSAPPRYATEWSRPTEHS